MRHFGRQFTKDLIITPYVNMLRGLQLSLAIVFLNGKQRSLFSCLNARFTNSLIFLIVIGFVLGTSSFLFLAKLAVPNTSKRMTKEISEPMKLSPLVNSIEISKTIQIHALTKKLELSGKKVLSLCVGEPDFQPPPEVIDATVWS